MNASAKTLQAAAAFVPWNLARVLMQGDGPPPGSTVAHRGVALFADIAGFTPMSEKLAVLMGEQHQGQGHRGAEEMNRILNQTFTALIRPIHAFGGIVTRFSGDALTAFFPAPASAPNPSTEIISRAINCALHMQQTLRPLSPVTVQNEAFDLSVKIGLSYGPALSIHLGCGAGYREIVLAGPALDQATAAERHAQRGDTLIAPDMAGHLPPYITSTPATDGFARVTGALPPPPSNSAATALLFGISPDDYPACLRRLEPYVPQTIYHQLLMTQGAISGDYRRVANLFVLFEGLTYTTPEAGPRLQAYTQWAFQTVSRFDGTLLRVLTGDKGSGLHITFGAPNQHADDIDRAMRCALALKDDTRRPDFVTQQKIGLAAGFVFTAPIGAPNRREYTVLGKEINLSARLMTATAPDTILVDDYSYHRASARFQFETHPPLRLKGIAQPVVSHRLLTESATETNLKARFANTNTPIVGRHAVLTHLTQVADRAVSGKGQVIALSGKIGIGKTRLIQEVARYWLKYGGQGFMGQSSQHLQNNPYHIWHDFWFDFFDLTLEDTPAQRRRRVADLTRAIAPDVLPWIDSLAEVLGFPLDDQSSLHSLNPGHRRQKLHHLTLALLRGRARQTPLLALFDDLHWVDEASADLIDYVAQRIKDDPVLLCLLFRSSHDVPVEAIALRHCTWRTLEDLPADQAEALIQAFVGAIEIPPEISRDMFDKTQGTPLYVEEIINNLIATGQLKKQDGRYHFSDKDMLARTPDTLQDLIRARLDRLETETRDLAQVASVIDREFSFNLLREVYPYPMSANQMRQRLNKLRYDEITTQTQPDPNPNYFFKHALTYEVAYNSLAFSRRKTLHKDIALAIEVHYQHNLEEFYSSLVYHYQQAGMLPQALAYAIKAGQRAQQLYAHKTAAEYYRLAETLLANLPPANHASQATNLYLSRARLNRLQFDIPATLTDLDHALSLARRYEDTRSQAEAHNLRAELAFYQEKADVVHREAQTALQIARANAHLRQQATALYHMGVADMLSGNFDEAMQHLQQALALSKNNRYPALKGEALNKIATVYFFDGRLEWALKTYRQVQALRQQLGLKDKEAETLSNIATLQFRLNDVEPALQTAQQAVSLANAAGWKLLVPYVQLLQVEILVFSDRYAQAEALMQNTYPLFAADDEVGHAYAHLTHAKDILLDMNRLDQAVPFLTDSLAVMEKYAIFEEMARCLTGLGSAYIAQKLWDKAEICLVKAEQICREKHKSWYLAEIYAGLSDVNVRQNQLTEATAYAKQGLQAIKDRSNPDWHGVLLFHLATIDRLQGAPPDRVLRLYRQAIDRARARSRAIVYHQLCLQAGNQLLTLPSREAQTYGENWVKIGIAWLQSRRQTLPKN